MYKLIIRVRIKNHFISQCLVAVPFCDVLYTKVKRILVNIN